MLDGCLRGRALCCLRGRALWLALRRCAAVARVMIVGGGCRGRRLASELANEGHAVRITTRTEVGRAAIEAAGAECWVGTPDRLATLRGALDAVTIVCWMLATASGTARELSELHGRRLELFLTQAIDTTVRGFVYEARGGAPSAPTVPGATGGVPAHGPERVSDDVLAAGGRIVRAITSRSAIPAVFVTANPEEVEGWLEDARAAVCGLLRAGA